MKLYELLDCYVGNVEIFAFSCEEGYEVLYRGYSTKCPSSLFLLSVTKIGVGISNDTLAIVLL